MSETTVETLKRTVGEATGKVLGELTSELVRALGGTLAAVLVHGSAARGGYREGESDVDLVVVLTRSSREALASVANALQLARYSARVEAMILVAGEIPDSADVFPLLYDDMKKRHVLLHGSDPFAAVVVADRHRRLRIEQELREAQIRLRRIVIDAHGTGSALGGPVLRKARQVRFPLHALLDLKRVECADNLEAVLAKAGEVYKVETAPILRAREGAAAAHDALAALLTAAIDDVDRMESK